MVALDRQLGRQPDQNSTRMAASLTTLAATLDFKQVDHVLLSEQGRSVQAGQNVFIVQGDPKDPAHLRAHLPTEQAVGTSVEASFRQLAALDQRLTPSHGASPVVQQQDAPEHGTRAIGG